MPKPNKPSKPYPEFPLHAAGNGQWAKTIDGKRWYFGKWDDADAALERYQTEIHEIKQGRDPRRMSSVNHEDEATTVVEMLNYYLTNLMKRRDEGVITARYFSEVKSACSYVSDAFGRVTKVKSLRAADFTVLRNAFPKTWGPVKLGTDIQRIRTAFKWAAESEIIDRVPNFGPDFKKPSKPVVRRARQQQQERHGLKMFEPTEVQSLTDNSDGWLKACILLGVNGAFGASDCGRLMTRHIDHESGIYSIARKKTGIDRKVWLWPETRDAIKDALRLRPIAYDDNHEELCFLTSHGRPVWWQTEDGANCDNVGKAFRKLSVKLGIQKPGRSFYSLRRTFETVASDTGDQAAVDLVMGHADESMAAVYRQTVRNSRVQDVCQHVREWALGQTEHEMER